jgi:hypothetical protein
MLTAPCPGTGDSRLKNRKRSSDQELVSASGDWSRRSLDGRAAYLPGASVSWRVARQSLDFESCAAMIGSPEGRVLTALPPSTPEGSLPEGRDGETGTFSTPVCNKTGGFNSFIEGVNP